MNTRKTRGYHWRTYNRLCIHLNVEPIAKWPRGSTNLYRAQIIRLTKSLGEDVMDKETPLGHSLRAIKDNAESYCPKNDKDQFMMSLLQESRKTVMGLSFDNVKQRFQDYLATHSKSVKLDKRATKKLEKTFNHYIEAFYPSISQKKMTKDISEFKSDFHTQFSEEEQNSLKKDKLQILLSFQGIYGYKAEEELHKAFDLDVQDMEEPIEVIEVPSAPLTEVERFERDSQILLARLNKPQMALYQWGRSTFMHFGPGVSKKNFNLSLKNRLKRFPTEDEKEVYNFGYRYHYRVDGRLDKVVQKLLTTIPEPVIVVETHHSIDSDSSFSSATESEDENDLCDLPERLFLPLNLDKTSPFDSDEYISPTSPRCPPSELKRMSEPFYVSPPETIKEIKEPEVYDGVIIEEPFGPKYIENDRVLYNSKFEENLNDGWETNEFIDRTPQSDQLFTRQNKRHSKPVIARKKEIKFRSEPQKATGFGKRLSFKQLATKPTTIALSPTEKQVFDQFEDMPQDFQDMKRAKNEVYQLLKRVQFTRYHRHKKFDWHRKDVAYWISVKEELESEIPKSLSLEDVKPKKEEGGCLRLRGGADGIITRRLRVTEFLTKNMFRYTNNFRNRPEREIFDVTIQEEGQRIADNTGQKGINNKALMVTSLLRWSLGNTSFNEDLFRIIIQIAWVSPEGKDKWQQMTRSKLLKFLRDPETGEARETYTVGETYRAVNNKKLMESLIAKMNFENSPGSDSSLMPYIVGATVLLIRSAGGCSRSHKAENRSATIRTIDGKVKHYKVIEPNTTHNDCLIGSFLLATDSSKRPSIESQKLKKKWGVPREEKLSPLRCQDLANEYLKVIELSYLHEGRIQIFTPSLSDKQITLMKFIQDNGTAWDKWSTRNRKRKFKQTHKYNIKDEEIERAASELERLDCIEFVSELFELDREKIKNKSIKYMRKHFEEFYGYKPNMKLLGIMINEKWCNRPFEHIPYSCEIAKIAYHEQAGHFMVNNGYLKEELKCKKCGQKYFTGSYLDGKAIAGHVCNENTRSYYQRQVLENNTITKNFKKYGNRKVLEDGISTLGAWDIETFMVEIDGVTQHVPYAIGWYHNGKYHLSKGLKCTDDFIDWCLTNKAIMIGWNTCRFDILVILSQLIKRGLSSVEKNRGRVLSVEMGGVKFLDMNQHLQGSLKSACKSFGLGKDQSKTDFQHDLIKSWADVEKYEQDFLVDGVKHNGWGPYLEKDVSSTLEVSKRYIRQMYEVSEKMVTSKKGRGKKAKVVNEMQGALLWKWQTGPSMAYQISINMLNDNGEDVELNVPSMEEWCDLRTAMFGGRCYGTRKVWKHDKYDEICNATPKERLEMLGEDYLVQYDVTSLYPSAMQRFDMPHGKMINVNYNGVDYKDVPQERLGIYHVKFTCPKDIHWPILGRRKEEFTMDKIKTFKGTDKLCTSGLRWSLEDGEGFYHQYDLDDAVARGYKVQVFEGYEWEKRGRIFRDFVDQNYEPKKQQDLIKIRQAMCKALGIAYVGPKLNPVLRQATKITLNSSYGSYGMKPTGSSSAIVSTTSELEKWLMENELEKLVDVMDETGKIQHTYLSGKAHESKVSRPTQIAISILAASRKIMNEFVDQCTGNVFYIDTDSLLVKNTESNIIRNTIEKTPTELKKELGTMEAEATRIIGFKHLCPKVYQLTYLDEEGEIHYKTRSKGIPFNKELLLNGEKVTLRQDKHDFDIHGKVEISLTNNFKRDFQGMKVSQWDMTRRLGVTNWEGMDWRGEEGSIKGEFVPWGYKKEI